MASTGLGTTSATTGLGTTSAGIGAGSYGKVILTVKSAHNMRDKAWLGKSDPYCVIRLADAEIQTHHVKNAGEHCTWDESFAFNNVSPDDVIEFTVYDHNRLLKDAHMGEGSISLRQVFTENQVEMRVPLTTRSGTKDAGEIWITMRQEGGSGIDAQGATGMGAGYQTTEGTGYERREDEYVGREGMYGAAAVPAVATQQTTAPVVASGEHYDASREAVCGREYFTKVEDRPVIKERVTRIREHHPVEKEFVVETRATGQERETGERAQEHMGANERVVEVAQPVVEQPTAEYFTKVEDRPVMKERVTRMREHHPVEKEFVVETRFTGEERETGQRTQEHVGASERVVEVAQPRGPCE